MTSTLQQVRQQFQPTLPKPLQELQNLQLHLGEATSSVADQEELKELFPYLFGSAIAMFKSGRKLEVRPLKIGVVLSGGQASGGHNVISGLFDAIKKLHKESKLYGFLNGSSGITEQKYCELTKEKIAPYRNQGGFDLIGSGRTKIETEEQLKEAEQTARTLGLDGIVVVGGDDSNTNAAVLAEYFKEKECPTSVVGVPKTIDGDLRNEWIELSFGCDTACKTYSELIGNIARDALSAKKYYYFIKLMGRSASHITLECALQTHPNIALIGEEIEKKNQTFREIIQEMTDLICRRSAQGKDYGVVLIPEGLIEFIPEFKVLISELNQLLAEGNEKVVEDLSKESRLCFDSLPQLIQQQLLMDRDPHGNVQVSKIETERLVMQAIEKELQKRKESGEYQGEFSTQHHFFGYEGRSAFPSNFDARYCYALGHVAALLVHHQLTGYMSCIKNLRKNVEEWEVFGIPITHMMNIEERKGKQKPVIKKALVDLSGSSFKGFVSLREKWGEEDHYRYPGPIQYFGDSSIKDATLMIL